MKKCWSCLMRNHIVGEHIVGSVINFLIRRKTGRQRHQLIKWLGLILKTWKRQNCALSERKNDQISSRGSKGPWLEEVVPLFICNWCKYLFILNLLKMISWLMRYNLQIFHLSLYKIHWILCSITSLLSNWKMPGSFRLLSRKVELELDNGLSLMSLAWNKENTIGLFSQKIWHLKQKSNIFPRTAMEIKLRPCNKWFLLGSIDLTHKKPSKI